MTETEKNRFVWVTGLKGPTPEKWPEEMPASSKDKQILAVHHLSDAEFSLTIAILEQRYPCPTLEQDQ